jgi:RNA polymerase sigma-70 factor (ECF subfamily)
MTTTDHRPPSAQEIVGGFNRKQEPAQSWIYHEYVQRVHDYVYEKTGHSPDTQDLVNDIFFKLFKNDRHLSSRFEIKNLLSIITKNRCSDYRKHLEVRDKKDQQASEHYQFVLEGDNETAEVYAHMGQFLWEQVEKLSSKTRDVIVLAYRDELSNKEIADRLGMTEKTVSNHKTEAKRILKIESDKRGGRQSFYLIIF